MRLESLTLAPRPRRVNPPRPAKLPAQGYRINFGPRGARIEAADRAGRFYARQTLKQIAREADLRELRGVIEDWPDFPVRGVMLDISRDKVPTMETLFGLVDLLAELKINHLELYTEHTFAYRRHRDVWKDASPMTAAEVRALDAFCRRRMIELVPNQNTFGHMHRWLKKRRYKHLAECPHGYVTPWSEKRTEPFSLNPLDPGSFKLVDELIGELAPNFRSRMINVGCDETFDLGQGKSRAECERRGKGRVYLDYLLKIHASVRRRGRKMLFWGDIILHHPELIPELPRDVIALVWGYEADHPFADQCAKFARAGIPFWVCPGTSSWNALAGRTRNMLQNIRSAARHGLKNGATGFLVTDWGDGGHWQPLPVSYPGFVAGAALSWCWDANRSLNLPQALDRHVFLDAAGKIGRAVCDLGNIYLRSRRQLHNASAFFRLLHQNDIAQLRKDVGRDAVVAAAEDTARIFANVAKARMTRADALLIQQELALVAAMLETACGRGLGAGKRELGAAIPRLLPVFRRVWLARNRRGGLSDSTSRLRARLNESSV